MPGVKPKDIFKLLSLLEPVDVDVPKMRVGNNGDGGYVLLDNLIPGQPIYSYGIGTKASFDRQLAELGHPIYMFDHTVRSQPGEHPNYHFHREGVGHRTEPDKRLYRLADHLERLGHSRDVFLKIDVEGAEWEVFAQAAPETLAAFSHIAIELHELDRINEPAFHALVLRALTNIRSQFSVVHVHANNFAPLSAIGCFPIANTLEVTFVRTSTVKTSPSRTLYPTVFDYPNQRKVIDHLLWFYPFAPKGELEPLAFHTCLELAQARADINAYQQLQRAARKEAEAAASQSGET
jgi:hypothetical protein